MQNNPMSIELESAPVQRSVSLNDLLMRVHEVTVNEKNYEFSTTKNLSTNDSSVRRWKSLPLLPTAKHELHGIGGQDVTCIDIPQPTEVIRTSLRRSVSVSDILMTENKMTVNEKNYEFFTTKNISTNEPSARRCRSLTLLTTDKIERIGFDAGDVPNIDIPQPTEVIRTSLRRSVSFTDILMTENKMTVNDKNYEFFTTKNISTNEPPARRCRSLTLLTTDKIERIGFDGDVRNIDIPQSIEVIRSSLRRFVSLTNILMTENKMTVNETSDEFPASRKISTIHNSARPCKSLNDIAHSMHENKMKVLSSTLLASENQNTESISDLHDSARRAKNANDPLMISTVLHSAALEDAGKLSNVSAQLREMEPTTQDTHALSILTTGSDDSSEDDSKLIDIFELDYTSNESHEDELLEYSLNDTEVPKTESMSCTDLRDMQYFKTFADLEAKKNLSRFNEMRPRMCMENSLAEFRRTATKKLNGFDFENDEEPCPLRQIQLTLSTIVEESEDEEGNEVSRRRGWARSLRRSVGGVLRRAGRRVLKIFTGRCCAGGDAE